MPSMITPVSRLALSLALATTACGQVTGLSDDYEFDLVDGGAGARDGAGDGAVEAGTCSATAAASATARMLTINGAPACKSCLASACCTQIDTCTRAADCTDALTCKLECTLRPTEQRGPCMSRCDNGATGVPASYSAGVGACGIAACTQPCGLQ